MVSPKHKGELPPNREMREVIRPYLEKGYTCERRGMHFMLRFEGKAVATFSGTHVDSRAYKNVESVLKRFEKNRR